MIENVEILINLDIHQILKSGEYTMLLLRTYSALYLEGKQPGSCESCIRSYFEQIKKDGKMKAELKKEVDKRTCVPAWSGIKFVRAIFKDGEIVTIHQHISSETITDKKAIELLESGALTKEDFKMLPESMIKKSGRPKKEENEKE